MITKTGSAAQSGTIHTLTVGPGFRTVGFVLETATPVPASAVLRLDVATPQPTRNSVAVVAPGQAKATGSVADVYSDTGESFTYQVTPINFGANPVPNWTAHFWIYEGNVVA